MSGAEIAIAVATVIAEEYKKREQAKASMSKLSVPHGNNIIVKNV